MPRAVRYERELVGIALLDPAGDEVQRLVPRHAGEAALAAAAHHRIRQPAEVAQLRAAELAQLLDVGEHRRVERAHRVDPQQVEPRRAEVDAGDRPVVEAGDTERAAVAHALAQDAPRVRQVAAVLPDDLRHVAVVVRLLLADAVRPEADPEVLVRASVVPEPRLRIAVLRPRRAPRIAVHRVLWRRNCARGTEEAGRCEWGLRRLPAVALAADLLNSARLVAARISIWCVANPARSDDSSCCAVKSRGRRSNTQTAPRVSPSRVTRGAPA